MTQVYGEEILAEEQVGAFRVAVVHDSNPPDPRENDCFGHMMFLHNRYALGDKHDFKTPEEFDEWWEENGKGGVRLPVYMYEHNELFITTEHWKIEQCQHWQWDSGMLGYIYATRQDILDNWMVKRVTKEKLAHAERLLRGEVDEYNAFVQGHAYAYIIMTEDGEVNESCWGFLDMNKDAVLAEGVANARSILAYHAKQKIRS